MAKVHIVCDLSPEEVAEDEAIQEETQKWFSLEEATAPEGMEEEIYNDLVDHFEECGPPRKVGDNEFWAIYNDMVDQAHAPPLCPVCDGLSPDNSACNCGGVDAENV